MFKKKKMPLAELHCHIEGTIAPDMARKLATRHGEDISHIFDDHGNYNWSAFPGFLEAYDVVSSVVQSVDDYYDITFDYLTRAADEGLIYSEMFVSSEHPEDVGIPFDAFLDGVTAALNDVEEKTGLIGRIILTAIRHRGPQRAEKTAAMALKHPHEKLVGFGLAGDESQFEPRDFIRAYDMATEAGLHRTAHAGEVEGPASIAATLDALKPERIGHGVRLFEDPNLVPRIRDEGLTLELCPGSNIAIGLYDSYERHPLPNFLRNDIKVTLSTDDPPFFHTTIANEHAKIEAAHGLSKAQMIQFTLNSIDAAFCDKKTKKQLRKKAEKWAKKYA